MSKITAAQIEQNAAFSAAVQGSARAVSVAYAATVTPNADTTDLLSVGALTGALALANPTGTPADWKPIIISLKATGADRVVTLGSAYQFPSTSLVASPFTVTSGTETLLAIRWSAASSKWRVVSIVSGFST